MRFLHRVRWLFKKPRTLEEIFQKYNIQTSEAPSDCPDGWINHVDECFGRLCNLGWDRKLFQVEEKFGCLRIYLDGDDFDSVMQDIIHSYEDRSKQKCGVCGAYAKKDGINVARCDQHCSVQVW